jgi:hypothetical protein
MSKKSWLAVGALVSGVALGVMLMNRKPTPPPSSVDVLVGEYLVANRHDNDGERKWRLGKRVTIAAVSRTTPLRGTYMFADDPPFGRRQLK